MKKLFPAGLLFACSLSVFFLGAFAPATIQPQVSLVQDTIPQTSQPAYEKVDIEATFPGGDQGWIQFLQANLDPMVPVIKGAPEGQYTVYIQFIVNKDGTLSDIKALTSHGYGMEQEVVRILKKSPTWNAAIQNGRKVNAYRKQPVIFRVIEEKKRRKRRG